MKRAAVQKELVDDWADKAASFEDTPTLLARLPQPRLILLKHDLADPEAQLTSTDPYVVALNRASILALAGHFHMAIAPLRNAIALRPQHATAYTFHRKELDRSTFMFWSKKTEREKWAERPALSDVQRHVGISALDPRSQWLYGRALPRGVLAPRLMGDRPPVNYWMRPHELAAHAYIPGQIILGKLGDQFIGHLDDRPMITMAGARAGKTSTTLLPNLYLYGGSILALDPKCDLAGTARLRQALGHRVHILDPFGLSGEISACFNPLAELDPRRISIIDDVASITQAIIVDDGDSRAKHWNDSAKMLLLALILLTLLLPETERNLVTVRQLLTLSHPSLAHAVKNARLADADGQETFYNENKAVVETLLRVMVKAGQAFGGVLASIGNRFLSTPQTERGSIFSTASAQSDFLDSLPIRAISKSSSFKLADLRGERPTTIYLCLPVGRMQSHYRWLRMIVQLACLVLEQMGPYGSLP